MNNVSEPLIADQGGFKKWLLLALGLFVLVADLLVLIANRGIGYGTIPVLVLSIILLFYMLREKAVALCRNEWIFIFGLVSFPAAIGLSMLLHGDWEWSSFDKPSRFLLVIPLYLVVRHFGMHRKFWFIGAIGGAIGAGVFGYYQKYIEGLSVASGFTHKIPFGDISLMLGMFSLAIFIPNERWKPPKWLLVLAVLGFGFGLLGSLCSGTRGGWVALPLLIWLTLSAAINSRMIRWVIYGLFVAGLVIVYNNNSMVQYKVDRAIVTTHSYFSEGKIEGSAGTRLEMWRGAWIQFVENPWIGVGKENYASEALRMKSEGLFKTDVYDHPHNDMLNLLAELGIIGGLSMILLYGLLIRFFAHWRHIDPQLACAGLLLTFGYIDFSLTQAMLEHNISTSFLALNVAAIAGMLSHSYLQTAKGS